MPPNQILNFHRISVDGGNEHLFNRPSIECEVESGSAQKVSLKRQSSVSQSSASRNPRTTNHVRFDLQETSNMLASNVHTSPDEAEESHEDDYFSIGRSSTSQSAPLLTSIEAPSVTTALEINVNDLLESTRPKSGMSSAFMNMANSIIGAGIIGRDSLESRKRKSSSGSMR